jgi:hypothetical protein
MSRALTVVATAPIDTLQQARLHAASSRSAALLANGAGREEIAQAVSSADREQLAIAIAGLREQLRPPSSDREEAVILSKLAECLALVAVNAPAQRVEQYQRAAIGRLERLPFRLVVDALDRVMDSCRIPGDILPMVIEFIGVRQPRMEAELQQLCAIADAAGVRY